MNVDDQMNSTAETAGDLLPQRNSSPSPSPSTSSLVLHPRREPFEHGLLPIPKLIFTDGTLTLSSIKDKLLSYTNPHSNKVTATFLAETLQIPVDQAELVIETLASVLPSGREEEVGGTANVYDLVLLLYIQSYKRLLPRTHKDSVAVTDVWPSTSAFDGYLSALSPLQLVRTNSRRSMPSQADEEAHQLSFLQKHMVNILSLLAETVEGEGNETLVLSLERFEHLELLIQFRDKSSERIQLSQAAPFFANSDPDMPAAPVSVAQVHEWILQNISASLDHTTEKALAKDNGPSTILDGDVTMADACINYSKGQNNAAYSRSLTFIEGVSKASVVKKECDIKGSTIKVLNCHDSVIYILAPLRYATVYGCSDATIVLGAIGKAVRVEHCERVHIIAAAKRICIANCRECIFYLGVNQRPLILGDNHKLQVAPFNTFYVEMKEHMNKVRLHATISRWNEPLVLGMVDPHDSLSHPAGVSDVQAESATCLDPNQFTTFLIPNWFGTESSQPTIENPFPLPEEYMASLKRKSSAVEDIRQVINAAELDENKKKELASAFHAHFKDWLYATGNIRQLYCLQGD